MQGNSGGPLLNMKGQLIGINSSKYAGVGIEGINFSIPLDTINYVLNQFEQNGKVIRPDLGALHLKIHGRRESVCRQKKASP